MKIPSRNEAFVFMMPFLGWCTWLIHRNNVRHVAIEDDIIFTAVAGMNILYIFMFMILQNFLEPKKRAWIISIFNSLTLSAFGIYRCLQLLTGSEHVTKESVHSDDMYSKIGVISFASSNAIDCILSLLYYPNDFNVLSGWIHHIFYIVFVFFLVQFKSTHGFSYVFIEELPTAVLSLSHVFTSLRSDWLFGSVFFLTRVVYHTWFIYKLITENSSYWIVASIVLVLHVYWMVKWILSMIKKRSREIYSNTKSLL